LILYLSRNENVNLLDNAANERGLHIRKMSGSFSFAEFARLEMRKYTGSRFLFMDRLAITENDSEFIEAIQSFKLMYNARIIVIYENADTTDSFTRGLAQIGVTDIVTASSEDGKQRQITACLSSEGMRKYKPAAAKTRVFCEESPDDNYEEPDENNAENDIPVQRVIPKRSKLFAEMDNEQYRFDCVNVKIGIIGATRRVGVTTFALGLANFIKNHGGTACYVAINTNQHLNSIADAYDFDTEEDYYTWSAIDFYENILPKHDYNFIISDFGDIKREAVKKYKESDIHLFCGASDKQFEIAEFADKLKSVKSVKPRILTYAPNHEYKQLFNSAVTDDPAVVEPVRNMLDYKTNGTVFKEIVKEYIVETSKRL